MDYCISAANADLSASGQLAHEFCEVAPVVRIVWRPGQDWFRFRSCRNALGPLRALDNSISRRLPPPGLAGIDGLIVVLNALVLGLTLTNLPAISDSHLVQWELAKKSSGIGLITEGIGYAEPLERRCCPSSRLCGSSPIANGTPARARTAFDFFPRALARQDGNAALVTDAGPPPRSEPGDQLIADWLHDQFFPR